MKISLLPLLVFVTFFSAAQGIDLTESQYLQLEEEARSQMNGNKDKAFAIAEKIGKSNNQLHRSSAAGIKSYLYQLGGEEELSNEQYSLAFKILSQAPSSKAKKRMRMVLKNYGGLIQWKREEFRKAHSEFEEGRAIALQLDDKPQLMKFLNNLARVDVQAQNYKTALATLKTSDDLFRDNADNLTQEQYRERMSMIQYNLGFCYDRYGVQTENLALVDSAIRHYEICIRYSDDQSTNRISAQINTVILMEYKGETEHTEKRYFNLLKFCEENDFPEFKSNILFNLGRLYLDQKKYLEAQSFFEKVQQFYEESGYKYLETVYSNYYLAVIQDDLGNYDRAEEYLELFRADYIQAKELFENQVVEFNFAIGKSDLQQGIEELDAQIKFHRKLIYIYIISGALVVVILLILLRKSIVDKRKVKLKLKDFKDKFNQEEQERKKNVYSNTIQNFTMNDEKEKEILIALEKLIDKEYYLTNDFSLQNAAKKIKTNTTYLSHVVNKNYGKSFSEYSNELKVNYVIRQLMENKIYRKYSTQAMAESVGYKSAISFTRSFKKRTGVTPVQFLKSVES